MARPPSQVQASANFDELVRQEIPRDRALLASRLGALRVERDLNWRQLAVRAGVSHKQIEEVEAGRRDPQFSTVIKLAKALELRSLDELLGPSPLQTALAELNS